jgi:hypothetical protein
MTEPRRLRPFPGMFALVVLALASAGPAPAITNGQVDSAGAYPNVGAFVIEDPDGEVFPLCTGTLGTPSVFLTAGHGTEYFEDVLAPLGYVAYASFDGAIPFGYLTSPATVLAPVAGVMTNPGYSGRQSDAGDLGVLVLAAPAAGVPPATLPACALLDRLAARNGLGGATFTNVGYGLQDRTVGGGNPVWGDVNPVPRMYSLSTFNALNRGYVRLSQNASLGNGGTCFGDSGGPNFLVVGGQLVLVAVTSTGDSACRATNVDYRLDIPEALGFFALVNESWGTSIPVSTCP